MERLFLNNNFHYVKVVPVSNGSGWTVEALSEQITSLFLASDAFDKEIIVWVDRERREETSEEIYHRIQSDLVAVGANPERVHILICDRMTENIILADEEVIRQETDDPDYEFIYEGSGGKALLKEHYRSIGESYRETVQGLRLLKRIRLRHCTKSPSVQQFLSTWQHPCWWIDERPSNHDTIGIE